MNRRTLLAALAAVVAIPAVAQAAGNAGPAVTMRVEGVKRTLLLPKVVKVGGGWVTRFGAPAGACPKKSAQGALDVATKHHWGGVWESSFGSYEVLTIRRETHKFTSKYFWELFANNAPASVGACEQQLRRGEQLLFAAVPQTGSAFTTATRAPRTATVGIPFTVKVVWFNGAGKAAPLAGARVTGASVSTAVTNSQGQATVIALHSGALVLHAEHAWTASTAYVRAAPVTVHVS